MPEPYHIPGALAGSSLQRRFALPASFSPGIVADGDSYTVTLQFLADQTGGAFLATDIVVGWRVLTANQQLYEITALGTVTLSAADVTLLDLSGTSGTPSGAALVYQYDGSSEAIPFVPVNSTGISAALSAVIATHNAGVVQEQFLGVGAAPAMSEARLRALAADPTERTVRIQTAVAIAAPLPLPAHLAIVVETGGYFSLADAADLIIEGEFSAPRRLHVFRGEGRVYLPGTKFARPDWFGAKANSDYDREQTFEITTEGTRSYHAFRKAKFAVGEHGTVRFNTGVYFMDDVDEPTRSRWGRGSTPHHNGAAVSWYNRVINGTPTLHHHVRVKGAGMGKTHLVPPKLNANGDCPGGVSLGVYRSGGWRDASGDLASQGTFQSIVRPGQKWLEMKSPEMAAVFTPGMVTFTRNGANKFDQDLGQFNIPVLVQGSIVIFKYPFQRDLSLYAASHFGGLSAFTMPAEGATVQVTYTASDTSRLGGNDQTFSYYNNLFEVVSEDGGGLFTIRNVAGKENDPAGTQFPDTATSGIGPMKSRTIFPCDSTIQGAQIEDMTVVGFRDAWVTSNFVNCSARNVELKHGMDETGGGLTMNADGGFNFLMENCYTHAKPGSFAGSQFARSLTNFHSRGSRWVNVKHSVIEFAEGCQFIGDTFEFDSLNNVKPGATNVAAWLLGGTQANTLFDNCKFYVAGEKVFGNSDIGSWTGSAGGKVTLRNCEIFAPDVDNVLSFDATAVHLTNVRMEVNAGSIFGGTGGGPLSTDRESVAGAGNNGATRHTMGAMSVFDGVEITGTFDQLFGAAPTSLKTRNCVAVRRGGRGGSQINHDGVVAGTLVDKAGGSFETFRVDVEFEVQGFPIVSGIPGNKFSGVLVNEEHGFKFKHVRPRGYTQNGDNTYTFTGILPTQVEELRGAAA